MSLIPPTVEVSLDEGFTDKDLFHRAGFGNQLTALALAAEGPTVLVLDAPWGEGKTTFIRMWCGALKGLGVPSIYFDAFANDYRGDPFLALAGEVLARSRTAASVSPTSIETFKRTAVNVGKLLLPLAAKIAVRFATAGLVNAEDVAGLSAAVSDTTKASGDEAVDAINRLLESRLEAHASDEAAFTAFREALTSLAADISHGSAERATSPPSRPLVFVVDELDRCRPDFALEILEKIKHFFSVPGVVFVLVTNMRQLEASVQFAYGNIDARRYLEKFYHHRAVLPDTDGPSGRTPQRVYIDHNVNLLFPKDIGDDTLDEIKEFVAHLSAARELRLRTLERILSNIAVAMAGIKRSTFLPVSIFSGLATLKVCDPDLYERARRGTLSYDDAASALYLPSTASLLESPTNIPKWSTGMWAYALQAPLIAETASTFEQGFGTIRLPREKIIPWACSRMEGDGLFSGGHSRP